MPPNTSPRKLSDEISSESTGGSSRSRKSIDRSVQWAQLQLADMRVRCCVCKVFHVLHVLRVLRVCWARVKS